MPLLSVQCNFFLLDIFFFILLFFSVSARTHNRYVNMANVVGSEQQYATVVPEAGTGGAAAVRSLEVVRRRDRDASSATSNATLRRTQSTTGTSSAALDSMMQLHALKSLKKVCVHIHVSSFMFLFLFLFLSLSLTLHSRTHTLARSLSS